MVFDKAKKIILQKKNELFPKMIKKMRLHYADNYETKSIDENLVLYETRDGNSIVDSPYRIFLELSKNPEYTHFKHIWIVNEEIENIENCIPNDLRNKVTFVVRGTIEYVDAMLSAKYLISNSTFETFFTKRPGQVYINTWHGTPLKHMGFDIPGFVNHSQNVLRNFLMADYILSPNEHTSKIFINNYKLDGIYPGKILEGGYPRIDATITSDQEEVKNKIRSYGVNVDSKKTILFCPTWKGSSVQNTDDDIDQIAKETLTLVDKFQTDYNVLLKVHPFVAKRMGEDERVKKYLVSDLIDANEVLSIVDILITDYSSIFFDFLVTKKPIIFYSWDKDLYKVNRGMYFSEEELPGPIVENINELIESIENVKNNDSMYQDAYQNMADKIIPYEDGQVTKRYINRIFKGTKHDKIKEYKVDSTKKKLLIYPGGMVNNGITSSALNLINNIDYEKYDVTVIVNSNRNIEVNNNINLLNKNARPIFRFGMNILTRQEAKLDKNFNVNGINKNERSLYPEKGYKREMSRLTANLKFDVAIDFSGYSYFWARHILSSNAKKYVAFMHNDLMEDSNKVINGKQPRKQDLQSLFSIYYQFDKLLSVSPMTRDVNLEKLAEFVTKDQMSYVYNSINIDEILADNSAAEEVEENNELNIEQELKFVKMSVEVNSFKNLDYLKENQSIMIQLNKGDDVLQHASYSLEGIIYGKVSINGIYVGWIDQRHFEMKPLEIFDVKKYHGIATVSRGYGFTIWNKMRTFTEEDVAITTMDYFKQRYLEVKQVATTPKGRFFNVYYDGKELGWLSSYPLMRMHKIYPFGLLSLYFKYKMRLQEKSNPIIFPNKIEMVTQFAKLNKDKKISIWSKPSNTNEAVELPITEEYYNEAFRVSQIVYFSDETHCRLELSNGQFAGFVKKEMLDFIDVEEFETITQINNVKSAEDMLPKVDLAMQKVPEFDSNYFNLINMGRLSPEKNQEQLITAFARFNEEIPNSRLYILGKGPLQVELVEHIRALKLEGKVMLLGHINNPFNFIKQNDYFVLPSFYEGQPMVLLESLTIRMKILASNIPANINVIGENEEYGLLTKGTSVDDIYAGLIRAYHHEETFQEFNYMDYNKKAMETFYKEIN